MKKVIKLALLLFALLWSFSKPWSSLDIFAPPLIESPLPFPDIDHPQPFEEAKSAWNIPWQTYQDTQSGLKLAVRKGLLLSAGQGLDQKLEDVYISLPDQQRGSIAITLLANPTAMPLDKFLESLRTPEDESYPANLVESAAWWGCKQWVRRFSVEQIEVPRFGCGNGLAIFHYPGCKYTTFIAQHKTVIQTGLCYYTLPVDTGRYDPSWEIIRWYRRIIESIELNATP